MKTGIAPRSVRRRQWVQLQRLRQLGQRLAAMAEPVLDRRIEFGGRLGFAGTRNTGS